MADVDLPPGIEPPAAEQPAEEIASGAASSEQASTEEKPSEDQPKKKNLYNDEYDLDEDNPLAGSDDEEDDIQVTIGKIEPINVQFSLKHSTHERTYASKLDIDAVPTINDQPIYDVDLASMEDRPWRKPGADITDYFNYGFTEETWNTYCERQKKLRTEFTSQAAVNKALFSNIYLANPLGMPAVTNRSTGVLGDTTSNVKVLTDNGGRFKVHHHNKDEPVMRTIIGAPPPTTPNTAAPPPTIDFSKPPPGMGMPPSAIPQVLGPPPTASEGGAEAPPGVEGPPGIEMAGQNTIPTVGSTPTLDMSMPPPGFNPSLPPPGMSVRPPPIGLPTVTIGPPGFNTMMPPPGYNPNQVRYPMNPGGGMGRPPPLMGREFDVRGGDMDDDERRRRRRSRSRSPRRNERDARRRDERDDRRDRDRDRKDRDRDRSDRSRRHRSRSREDRDKRRERRDDEDRKRRRDRDEEDERKDRRERRKKEDRSPDKEDRGSNDEEAVEQ